MRRKSLRWVPLAALAVVAAVVVSGALGASGQKNDLSGKKVGVIICTNQNPFCAAWANSVKSGWRSRARRSPSSRPCSTRRSTRRT